MPWHTERLRVIDVAAVAARACAALSKIARDVTLLAQTEVGEVKGNPVAAVAILGCARQAPGLLATLVACAEQEHQRAAGAWHAEWQPYGHLLELAASAAAWSRDLLAALEVDTARMAANLAEAGGMPLTERVSALLRGPLGAPQAHDLVATAAAKSASSGVPFRDVLLATPEIENTLTRAGISHARVEAALDPSGYLGSSEAFITAALEAHAGRAPSVGTAGYADVPATCFSPTAASQMTGWVALVAGTGRTPYARRMASTLPAIHASPAAVGCRPRPPSACWNFHWPASGSMMMTLGSAAVAVVTMTWSVRRSACVPPGGRAKTVSNATRAPGAARWIRPSVARTPARSGACGTPTSSWPACTITTDGCERAQPLRAQHARHRAVPGRAVADVAGPGHPVDDGVPVQQPGQHDRPGQQRVVRARPGGEGGADDRDGRQPARLALMRASQAARGVATVSSLVLPRCPGPHGSRWISTEEAARGASRPGRGRRARATAQGSRRARKPQSP